eukprot:6877949-Pyramimonas_sp.AAC.1
MDNGEETFYLGLLLLGVEQHGPRAAEEHHDGVRQKRAGHARLARRRHLLPPPLAVLRRPPQRRRGDNALRPGQEKVTHQHIITCILYDMFIWACLTLSGEGFRATSKRNPNHNKKP